MKKNHLLGLVIYLLIFLNGCQQESEIVALEGVELSGIANSTQKSFDVYSNGNYNPYETSYKYYRHRSHFPGEKLYVPNITDNNPRCLPVIGACFVREIPQDILKANEAISYPGPPWLSPDGPALAIMFEYQETKYGVIYYNDISITSNRSGSTYSHSSFSYFGGIVNDPTTGVPAYYYEYIPYNESHLKPENYDEFEIEIISSTVGHSEPYVFIHDPSYPRNIPEIGSTAFFPTLPRIINVVPSAEESSNSEEGIMLFQLYGDHGHPDMLVDYTKVYYREKKDYAPWNDNGWLPFANLRETYNYAASDEKNYRGEDVNFCWSLAYPIGTFKKDVEYEFKMISDLEVYGEGSNVYSYKHPLDNK